MFRFYLDPGTAHRSKPNGLEIAFEYDNEIDDLSSILADICDALDETRLIAFRVEGFGQYPWPVDVATDLLVFLEQLPEFVEWLFRADTNSHTLDFYEQGIERKLTFDRRGETVQIACQSQTKWQPNPSTEIVMLDALRAMQRSFLQTFLRLADSIAPDFVLHPWFRSWRILMIEKSTAVVTAPA